MSIGLVLRHTYEETCEICEKIANLMKIIGKKWNVFFTRVDMYIIMISTCITGVL